jgi:hypothetical protein
MGHFDMTEKFSYVVERLYRANLRISRCKTSEERQQAQRWLRAWNAAVRREYDRAGRHGE